MESLSKLGAVVMDKTGTITEGNFKLQKTVSSGSLSEDELLALCAGCEQHSTHPIAVSIVAAAREKGTGRYSFLKFKVTFCDCSGFIHDNGTKFA